MRPDPTKFPEPQRYGTYITHRSSYDKFKTHSTLAICKNAIAGKANGRILHCDAWVYEFDFDAGLWREIAHLPQGTSLNTDPWYSIKQSGKAQALGPSQAAVDAAVASIQATIKGDS